MKTGLVAVIFYLGGQKISTSTLHIYVPIRVRFSIWALRERP
jgi:hypothetical protein